MGSPVRAVEATTTFQGRPDMLRGRPMAMPSGRLCRAMAAARASPSALSWTKPAPMASPSGRLCRAIPRPITTPNRRSRTESRLEPERCRWGTVRSMRAIRPAPSTSPATLTHSPPTDSASGMRSKAITASIIPAENPNRAPSQFLPGPVKSTASSPPRLVPSMPAANPIRLTSATTLIVP